MDRLVQHGATTPSIGVHVSSAIPTETSLSSGLTFGGHYTLSCPACKANLPDVQRVQAAYRNRGLYTVAVHMPRSESDTNLESVARAVAELGMTEPCAIDNDHTIGDRFQTTGLWPYYYLFDGERKLRRHAAGGSGFALVERVIERLLPASDTA